MLIIIEDKNPKFVTESNFYGVLTKNENIAKYKMKYREMVGTEFSIHGSISVKETNHDVTLLLHKTLLELQNVLPKKWDGTIRKMDLVMMVGTILSSFLEC